MSVKVLHVISTLDPRAGGPVNAVEGMTSAMARLGAEIEVITTFRGTEDTSPIDRMKADGITVTRIGPVRTPLGHHPKLKAEARQAVARNQIVHIHALWENIQHFSAREAMRTDKPYIITPHGMLDPWALKQSPIRKKIYMAFRLRRTLKDAAALHFTADTEKSSITLPIKADSFVEPLGLDLTDFESLPEPGQFRRKWSIPDTAKLITFLGRIHPGKGLEYLVPALAELNDPNCLVAVVGPDSGGFAHTIEQRIKALNLNNRVLFTGSLSGEEKLSSLVDADLFCLPSDHENFGIVVIEALACGTPVLISDQVKICREIEEANAGRVCQTSTESLVVALRQMLQGNLAESYPPAEIRSFVHRNYDWSLIAEKMLGHYHRFIQKSACLEVSK